jgi:hypothetical protein
MPPSTAGVIADHGSDADALWGKDFIDKGREVCGWG